MCTLQPEKHTVAVVVVAVAVAVINIALISQYPTHFSFRPFS